MGESYGKKRYFRRFPYMKRLFLGITPPPAHRAAIAAWQAAHAHLPEMRWVEPSNLHLTVYFFGQIEELALPNFMALAALSVPKLLTAEALTFTPIGVTLQPKNDAPRMMWLQMARNIAFERLAQQLHQRFQPLMPTHQAHRKPVPHITIARFPAGAHLHTLHQQLPPLPLPAFSAAGITLFESITAAEATQYVPLNRFE